VVLADVSLAAGGRADVARVGTTGRPDRSRPGRLRLSGSVRLERIDDVQAALEGVLPVKTHLTRFGDLVISKAPSSSVSG
jgi:ferric-dicitrate binding protein FerR (iron transport regulator)